MKSMDKLTITTGHLARDVEESGTTLIQVSLQHPVIDNASTLDQCFRQAAENLVAALTGSMIGEARAAFEMMPEALPYQISANFTVTFNGSGMFSYYTDVFLYAGGLHGITYRYGSSWYTADGGRPLFITALFPADTDIKDTVTRFVAGRVEKEQDAGTLPPKAVPTAVADYYAPENFYLMDSGLAVFYQPHTIAPPAAGIPVFSMPYSHLGPFSPVRLMLG